MITTSKIVYLPSDLLLQDVVEMISSTAEESFLMNGFMAEEIENCSVELVSISLVLGMFFKILFLNKLLYTKKLARDVM